MISEDYSSPDFPTSAGGAIAYAMIDDFLARGATSAALLTLVREAGATPVGYGCVIEKAFEGGREHLRGAGYADVRIEALATIASMDDGKITLA